MIAALTGTVRWQMPTQLIVCTDAGVDYEVTVSMHTHDQLKAVIKNTKSDKISLHTYLQIRDNPGTMCLYGFFDVQERMLFLQLIRVNDIGPALALRILSAANPQELVNYIANEKTDSLKKIKGIGNKIAERLVIELKDSLGGITVDSVAPRSIAQEEAVAALVQLGVKKQQATRQLAAVTKHLSSQEIQALDAEALIKLALAQS